MDKEKGIKAVNNQKEDRNESSMKYTESINKMVVVSTYLAIIILNLNRLNSPIKRQSGQRNKDPTICCLLELISALSFHTGLR